MRAVLITMVLTAGLAFAAPAAATVSPATRSTYLAGYQLSGVDMKRGSMSFTIPAVTCPDSTFRAVILGIGNEPVVGAPTLLAGVLIGCSSGAPVYALDAYSANGVEGFQTGVSPGDVVTVRVAESKTSVTATANDRTARLTASTSAVQPIDQSMTFGAFPAFGGSPSPVEVPQFSLVRMRSAMLNGVGLSTLSPTRLNRVKAGLKRIITSPFSTTGAFSLRFVHN